ncbi:MAG: hypothetical protein EBQ96_08035 [Proteobacteria bacterium]|nr:hypothetical protein [Pseudomonadota bacterium]
MLTTFAQLVFLQEPPAKPSAIMLARAQALKDFVDLCLQLEPDAGHSPNALKALFADQCVLGAHADRLRAQLQNTIMTSGDVEARRQARIAVARLESASSHFNMSRTRYPHIRARRGKRVSVELDRF